MTFGLLPSNLERPVGSSLVSTPAETMAVLFMGTKANPSDLISFSFYFFFVKKQLYAILAHYQPKYFRN